MGNAARRFAAGVAAQGHAVTVFTPDYGDPGVVPADPGVQIVTLRPWLKLGNGAWVPQLTAHLRGFEVVHFHYPFFGGVKSLLTGWLLWRFRLVVHYHMDTVGAGWRKWVFAAHRRLFLPCLIRAASRVIVTSWDYAQTSSQLAPYLKYREKFVELPMGVEHHRFSPGNAVELAQRYGVLGSPVILFVGGLDDAHYFKGVDQLLMALVELPQARLVVVGRGNRLEAYRLLAQKLGVSSRVVFADAVSDLALPDHYRIADVVVLPSVARSEAFGMVLLEGMASEKPVVASSLPGVRTVIQPQWGRLVPPQDPVQLAGAIREILDHPKQARQMGQAGRARVLEAYDWAKLSQRLVAMYAQRE